MYKRTIHSRYALQHVLQALTKVMTITQAHVLVKHDVNLYIELVTRMIRLETLYVLDCLGEAHREIEKNITLIGCGGCTAEVADVL